MLRDQLTEVTWMNSLGAFVVFHVARSLSTFCAKSGVSKPPVSGTYLHTPLIS